MKYQKLLLLKMSILFASCSTQMITTETASVEGSRSIAEEVSCFQISKKIISSSSAKKTVGHDGAEKVFRLEVGFDEMINDKIVVKTDMANSSLENGRQYLVNSNLFLHEFQGAEVTKYPGKNGYEVLATGEMINMYGYAARTNEENPARRYLILKKEGSKVPTKAIELPRHLTKLEFDNDGAIIGYSTANKKNVSIYDDVDTNPDSGYVSLRTVYRHEYNSSPLLEEHAVAPAYVEDFIKDATITSEVKAVGRVAGGRENGRMVTYEKEDSSATYAKRVKLIVLYGGQPERITAAYEFQGGALAQHSVVADGYRQQSVAGIMQGRVEMSFFENYFYRKAMKLNYKPFLFGHAGKTVMVTAKGEEIVPTKSVMDKIYKGMRVAKFVRYEDTGFEYAIVRNNGLFQVFVKKTGEDFPVKIIELEDNDLVTIEVKNRVDKEHENLSIRAKNLVPNNIVIKYNGKEVPIVLNNNVRQVSTKLRAPEPKDALSRSLKE